MATENISDNQFWLQIMGDNARFILFALSHMETNEIETAQAFVSLFDSLLVSARDNLTGDQLQQLNQEAFHATQDFRKFILKVLRRQINQPNIIYLHPAPLNSMVNETEEYLNILTAYMQNKKPDLTPIHLNLMWLLDAYAHAKNLANYIDITHQDILIETLRFSDNFNALFMRALLLNGLLRTGLTNLPALDQLSIDSANEMLSFKKFIEEIQTFVRQKKILGILAPLYLDHIQREICYIITNLSTVSAVAPPNCNPSSPRIE